MTHERVPKVTVLARGDFLVVIPHAPSEGIGDLWRPTGGGRIGCVVGDTANHLACSRQALDLMNRVSVGHDDLGEIEWWRCADESYTFGWLGPIFRIIDVRTAEAALGFAPRPHACLMVPNHIPTDIDAKVAAAIARGSGRWDAPASIHEGHGD